MPFTLVHESDGYIWLVFYNQCKVFNVSRYIIYTTILDCIKNYLSSDVIEINGNMRE